MAVDVHPSEFAYAFSYAKTSDVIGWGLAPFLPSPDEGTALNDWYREGEDRMVAAGRLVGTRQDGLNFTDDMTSAILALVNPGLVFLSQRKAGDGVRTLSVHAKGSTFIGLTRRPDGMFEMTRYADMIAAAGACAAFVGASLTALATEARIEADKDTLSGLKRLIGAGEADKATAKLEALGAAGADARSAILAMASPAAAGVVSVLYCRNNVVEDAETFSVMTNAQDATWIVFAPASPDGPVILERSSVAELTARVSVGVVARLGVTG